MLLIYAGNQFFAKKMNFFEGNGGFALRMHGKAQFHVSTRPYFFVRSRKMRIPY